MHRTGLSPQMPVTGRSSYEQAIAMWQREGWLAGNGSGGAWRVAVLQGRDRPDPCVRTRFVIVHGVDQLVAVVKDRLDRAKYRRELIDAFLAHTGLELDPAPP